MPQKSYATTDPDVDHPDSEFQERLRRSSPEQLEQCIRLLGLYVALYKRDHGELNESSYSDVLNLNSVDIKLAELMADGMDEANAILQLVQSEPKESGFTMASCSNRLN